MNTLLKSCRQKICKFCYWLLDTLNPLGIYDEANVQIGDVMWCIMPLSKEKLLQITVGHRIRPFVICEITPLGCIGYSCSSKSIKYTSKSILYCIHKEKYSINKTSYVDISKKYLIPFDNIQSYYFQLNNEDVNNILTKKFLEYQIQHEYGKGTILKKDNVYYLIYKIVESTLYAHEMVTKNKIKKNGLYKPFSIKGNIYYINLSSQIEINLKHDYEFIQTILPKQLHEIEKQKKKVFKEKSNQLPIPYLKYPIGSIFYESFSDNKFIYLYNRKGKSYGCYVNEDDEIELMIRKLDLEYAKQTYEVLSDNELKDIMEGIVTNDENKRILHQLKQQLKS